ncbi:GNAT family N-acetyltransferase [Vibrio sp. WJH972]
MDIIKSDQSNKHVIENMMQLYLHDLSPYTQDNPDQHGLFSLGKYFGLYWEDNDRFPYILIHQEKPVGFALVRRIENDVYSIAEFFVLRSARKQGFATLFSHHLFGIHIGVWQVAELEQNLVSQTFWRKTISSFTKGQFEESWSPSQPVGPMQTFRSGEKA